MNELNLKINEKSIRINKEMVQILFILQYIAYPMLFLVDMTIVFTILEFISIFLYVKGYV